MAYSICEQIQQRHVIAMQEAKDEYERMMKQTKEDYETLNPVSYTHLDVYKRQLLKCS